MFLALLPFACKDTPSDGGSVCDTVFFADADGDGFGGSLTITACEAPTGFVDNSDDCDDLDASSMPGGTEVCDGLDNDCNGTIDDSPSDGLTAFADADGDGFGGEAVTTCALEDGVAELDGDCDDGDASSHPNALEVCDGVDNDCDGSIDGHAVPSDYATIQEAVDAADDGDLICIDEGTYVEAVKITLKELHLEGPATIDVEGSYVSAMTLEQADGSSLRGLTLTGSSAYEGGGLRVQGTEGLDIIDVDITDNHCTNYQCSGPAMYIATSIVDLVDVDVYGNTIEQSNSYSYSYGVARLQASTVRWEGGSLSDNTVRVGNGIGWTTNSYSYGNGLLTAYSSRLEATDLAVEDNLMESTALSTVYGIAYAYGPIYLQGSQATLDGLSIGGNETYASGTGTSNGQSTVVGAIMASSSVIDVTNSVIDDNLAEAEGQQWAAGATVQTYGGITSWSDTSLYGNIVHVSGDSNVQCGTFYDSTGALDFLRVDLRDQSVSCDAASAASMGAVYQSNGWARYTNVTVAGNAFEADTFHYGLFTHYYSDALFENVTVHGNESEADGAYASVFTTMGAVGYASMELTNSAVTDNSLTVAQSASYRDASAVLGAYSGAEEALSLTWNDFHGNVTSHGADFTASSSAFDPIGTDGNVDDDPGYTSTSGAPDGWDLAPGAGSALIDAGDPELEDTDGTRSDIGATGGPDAQ